jgi:hypothetical protein
VYTKSLRIPEGIDDDKCVWQFSQFIPLKSLPVISISTLKGSKHRAKQAILIVRRGMIKPLPLNIRSSIYAAALSAAITFDRAIYPCRLMRSMTL